MLVFGPYRCIQWNMDLTIFNLSSLTQAIPRLPGLIPMITAPIFDEKDFDMWYYDYLLNDITACSSLMQILGTLYENGNVYVCISEYGNDPYMSMINESFMKVIQQRYDIRYYIVNEPSDWEYINRDGCDFRSVLGIQTFDEDKNRFLLLKGERLI